MAKIQPSPLKISFQIKPGVSTIDCSMAVSAISRRFMRQGNNWAVQDLEIFVAPGSIASTGLVTVSKLQDTWMVSNAWHKSYAFWREMVKEFALDIQPSIRPKYMDFKIFMNVDHYNDWAANKAAGGEGQQSTASALGTLSPIDLTSTFVLPGEWIPSKFITPAVGSATVDEWYLQMHGPDTATAVGLVFQYSKSRSVPQSPDPDTGGAGSSVFNNVFDQGTPQSDAVIADALDENDELPYDQDNYPGGNTNFDTGQIVLWDGLTTSNTMGHVSKLHTGPFNAQCGLIQIHNNVLGTESPNPPQNLYAILTLVPGDNRGYLTQPMQDV